MPQIRASDRLVEALRDRDLRSFGIGVVEQAHIGIALIADAGPQ
jgi:hypothetical protein